MARVLLIDDEADATEVVSRYLRKAGHEVACARTGRDALAALPTASPDVIVLDLRMPEMDGMSFLQVLRGYYRGSTMPVIVLTAMSEQEARRTSQLGVKRIFRKADYGLNELLECVNEAATPHFAPDHGGSIATM